MTVKITGKRWLVLYLHTCLINVCLFTSQKSQKQRFPPKVTEKLVRFWQNLNSVLLRKFLHGGWEFALSGNALLELASISAVYAEARKRLVECAAWKSRGNQPSLCVCLQPCEHSESQATCQNLTASESFLFPYCQTKRGTHLHSGIVKAINHPVVRDKNTPGIF